MPIEYADQMYCSQQILIPPTLPLILKKYAKAAIRTQPRDLLLWSLHYFRAVADGSPPPVKERIEFPPVETESGLTPGYLKVLLNQIGTVDTVSKDTIIDKWEGICLDRKYAELLFKLGNFPEQVEWIKFVALAAGTLEKEVGSLSTINTQTIPSERLPDTQIDTVLLMCGGNISYETMDDELASGDVSQEATQGTKMVLTHAIGDGTHSSDTASTLTLDYRSENLTGTMSLLCELLTEEPEGGSAIVSVETFLSLYKYLAALDCGPRQLDVTDSEEVKSAEEVEHSENKEEQQSEIWDDLLKDVGDDKSALTIATDDIKEVDSKDGLEVWPDLVPNDLKLAEESPDERVDTNSDIGLQVWDEDQLKQIIEEKEIIVPEGEEGEDEEEANKIASLEEKPAEGLPEDVENDAKETEEKGEEEEKETKEGVSVEESEAEGSGGATEDVGEVEAGEGGEEAEEEDVEEEAEMLPPVATLVEPNPDIALDPSPIGSEGSICTQEKSIESLGGTERETSTGQVLDVTTSMRDVRVNRKEVQDDYPRPECSPEYDFWVDIPGIGSPVPLSVVEDVEVYLRECAAKQCDMVMPRNLRHFLCPPIDGIVPEEISLPKPECDECAEEIKNERAKKLIVHDWKHVIF